MTPNSNRPTLPDETHVGRTALSVSDLTELTEFYRTVVGLELLAEERTTAILGVDGTPLLVLEEIDATPRSDTATGLFHNAFRVPSREVLGEALARVREHWRLDGASDHRVSEALYLSDAEGNGVEIYRDRPRAEWPIREDGTVGMTTEPLNLESLAAAGGDTTTDSRAPSGTDVGHVHLEVSSLADFRAVYVDTLGFAEMATIPDASFVAAGGYHHHVGANTWQGRTAPAEGRGLSWFEIVVPGDEALATVRERVTAGGQSVTDTERGSAVMATDTEAGFAVTDSDGIEIRFRAGEPSES